MLWARGALLEQTDNNIMKAYKLSFQTTGNLFPKNPLGGTFFVFKFEFIVFFDISG